MAASSFVEWLRALPIPWLFGGTIGQLDAGAQGAAYDYVAGRLKEAAKSHMPDYGPSDSLAPQGSNRFLIQGRNESAADFKTRLKYWAQYARAGTFAGVLEQLYFSCGLGAGSAVIKQQNGGTFWTAANPVAGQDPITGSKISSDFTTANTLAVALHSDVNTSRSIPIGNQWWTMDSNADWCARWWLLVPQNAGTPFLTTGTATFTGTEDGTVNNPWPTVTWSNPLPDATYKIIVGTPEISDGGGVVEVAADASSRTTTTCKIAASAAFTGTVNCVAYQASASSPWADPHPADLATMRTIINGWRPAKAACQGIYVLVAGNFIGYPSHTIGSVAPKAYATVVSFSAGA